MASSTHRLRRIVTVAQEAALLPGGLRNLLAYRRRLSPRHAYRLWSETYESQEGNPVLTLEHRIWTELLSKASVTDKFVLDIGVGTGRHWADLLSRGPRRLCGVDISPEMLGRLRLRFPDAEIYERTRTRIDVLSEGSIDLIASSLMLSYVRDVGDELREWTRLLRDGGEVIYTDFHPAALRAGAKRTFCFRGRWFEVESHCHDVEMLRSLFRTLRLEVTDFQEMAFEGTLLVLGFRLLKQRL